ncbi:MAG: AAA family ATPase [Erysipelotrichaceae bacterium]|nr:AAA family ATPase [Erysipelotrichaceae bacterium]
MMNIYETLKDIIKGHRIILIDGRCGSGKSSLGRKLKEEFDTSLIHTDDFYLPFILRDKDWKDKLAGHMDFKRLREEVIKPYEDNKTFTPMGYNAHEDCSFELDEIDPLKPLIIEGSYSGYFKDDNYLIFVTCDKKTQEERLRKREGISFDNFRNIWIKKEEDFFEYYHIEEKADMKIYTGENND